MALRAVSQTCLQIFKFIDAFHLHYFLCFLPHVKHCTIISNKEINKYVQIMITLKRKIEKVSFVFHLLSHIYRQPFLFYLIFEPDFSGIE